jgi:hypothetical protein
MAAGTITRTVPYCGACGWDTTNQNNGDRGTDGICDSCGADLTAFGFAAVLAATDLVAAIATDKVTYTFTENSDTTDARYSIDGAEFVFDDDVSSPYDVVIAAVGEVELQIRTVESGDFGPYSDLVRGKSGQSPPATLVAVAGSLEVSFTFTEDPAGDTVDLFYTIDAAGDTTVEDVTTGVAVVAAEGEVVEGQVRTVQDGVQGVYGAADSETAGA